MTISMKELLKELETHIPLSDLLIENIGCRVTKRRFGAKVNIISPNQNQNSLLFLTKGITRNYYKSEAKEWTSCFCLEGNFVLSIDNFLFDLPCNEFIETCTPIEFIEITKEDYLHLLSAHPELHIVARNIADERLRLSINRMYSWRMLSASERYHQFVKEYPRLNKQVQLQHIASYLDMSQYSLSRIRKQCKKHILLIS